MYYVCKHLRGGGGLHLPSIFRNPKHINTSSNMFGLLNLSLSPFYHHLLPPFFRSRSFSLSLSPSSILCAIWKPKETYFRVVCLQREMLQREMHSGRPIRARYSSSYSTHVSVRFHSLQIYHISCNKIYMKRFFSFFCLYFFTILTVYSDPFIRYGIDLKSILKIAEMRW